MKPGQIMTEQDVKDFCKGKIAHYKIPRYIMFVDDFPINISGKIMKFKMRESSIKVLGLQEADKIETA